MHVNQYVFSQQQWNIPLEKNPQTQWLLMFGSRELAANTDMRDALKAHFPNASLMGCTTSGEIAGDAIYDESLVITAVTFESADIMAVCADIADHQDSTALGKALANDLPGEGLRHVFVISEGHSINGSDLVTGIQGALPDGITVSGGLAGDADRFEETIVWFEDKMGHGLVVAVGLYGDSLKVGCGHLGGWKAFGPTREVTQSQANVVQQIDHQPALTLYKTFLGEYAADLPASALLYPIAVQDPEGEVVRTILSIDEEDDSMLFAGNVPQGSSVRLMHASYENLLEGAEDALEIAADAIDSSTPELALLVSCVGRRLVLGQRSEEELEVIRESLPDQCVTTGFYSYGEISPQRGTRKGALHNQTMTVTLLSEH